MANKLESWSIDENFFSIFLGKILNTSKRGGSSSNQIVENLDGRGRRIRQANLSKRNTHQDLQVDYEWQWIDSDWQWKLKNESYAAIDKNDIEGGEAPISEDGHWIWLNEEWKLLSELDQNNEKINHNTSFWYGKYWFYWCT